jgi:hypothetical protein
MLVGTWHLPHFPLGCQFTSRSIKDDANADWMIWNPKDLRRNMFYWGQKGESRAGPRSPKGQDVHLQGVFVQVRLGEEEAPTFRTWVLLLPINSILFLRTAMW